MSRPPRISRLFQRVDIGLHGMGWHGRVASVTVHFEGGVSRATVEVVSEEAFLRDRLVGPALPWWRRLLRRLP